MSSTHGGNVPRAKLAAAVTLALVAACINGEGPAGPRLPLPPVLADWTPGPLGEPHTLNTPPSNDVITPYENLNVSIPAGAPAKITVTGLLTFTVNDAFTRCNHNIPPAPPPGGIYTVGPAGFKNGGIRAWRVDVRPIGGSTIPYTSADDPSAETMTAFNQASTVQNLEAGRPTALNGACGDSISPYNPAYWVSGSQTVSVELLDSAHVEANPVGPVALGDTVTFDVTLSWDPNFSVSGYWVWVSDTTTSNSVLVGNCNRQKTCRAVVREKGHVEVNGISAGADQNGSYKINLNARSAVIAVVAPQLLVDCTGSGAPRGNTVTCHARPYPATESFSVTGWTFTSTAGDVVTRAANQSDSTWTGTEVVDGRIDVTGVVAGQTKAGSTNITVTPRDWTGRTVRNTHVTPGADVLPVRPDSFSQLGRTSMWMHVRPDPENYAVLITDGGPNDTFTYMTDIPFETFDTARVNYPAMAQGSDWYAIQYAQDTVVGGTTYCGQGRVLSLPPLIEAHEGTDPPSEPNSHVGIYVNDVNRLAPQPSEALAGKNPNPEPVRAPIENAALADSRAMDTDSRNNIVLPCIFTYDYTRLH